MQNVPSDKRLRRGLLGLGIVMSLAGSAQASGYSCRVPRALLCENCATHIAIALQANEAVLFTVYGPTPDTFARKATWRAHYVSLPKPASTSHCFVFNSEKYCE
jgi:hypothetical protein